MSAREAPLLLCRIYSTWRTIALSTPRLWASLHVSVEFVLSNELRMQAVTQWLQLSAACPLSLSINQNSASPSSGIPVYQSLVAYSDRWRHVEFMYLSAEAAHEIAEIRPPALESLIFARPRIHSLLNQLNLVEAPSLRALTSWGQLQHLTIDHGPVSAGGGLTLLGVITLLGRCTQLISFRFTPNESDEAANSVSISMPFLQTFIVSPYNMTVDSISYLIEHVSMPQLRQFDVPTISSTGPETFFLVPLGTSSPHIESLTIYMASLSAQSLPETLRSFPSLTTLVVYGNYDVWGWDDQNDSKFQPSSLDQLLDILTPSLGTTICPALQELAIKYCSVLDKFTLDAFILGRIEMTPGFRRFEIMSRDLGILKLLAEVEIQSYLLRGLDISLTHDNIGGGWVGLLRPPRGRACRRRTSGHLNAEKLEPSTSLD
ncbi:hypothetical protein B0H13DRAFT_2660805 [Mycena leptocephala]|nr:hypothetical protein B0H13DRAFT_2660805 [Mycena leptocephala]